MLQHQNFDSPDAGSIQRLKGPKKWPRRCLLWFRVIHIVHYYRTTFNDHRLLLTVSPKIWHFKVVSADKLLLRPSLDNRSFQSQSPFPKCRAQILRYISYYKYVCSIYVAYSLQHCLLHFTIHSQLSLRINSWF